MPSAAIIGVFVVGDDAAVQCGVTTSKWVRMRGISIQPNGAPARAQPKAGRVGRGGARERSGECPEGVSHGADFAPTTSRINTGRQR